VLTFFLYHFERIVTYEVEKSVREAAHETLGEFLITCKKNFAQHIVNLFPLWYISFYDTAQEIKTKAKNNFFNTFKTPEVRSALFRKSVEYQGAGDDGSGTTISQNVSF
jgi:ABC-type polar amino acid transport system ATPase subunit